VKQKISITINKKIIDQIDELVDGIIIKNRSQAIEHIISKYILFNKTAVILAGGDEKKLLNEEKDTYKPLMKLDGITIIEKMINDLSIQGFKKIFIIGREKIISELFKLLKNGEEFGVNIKYIIEKHSKGTFDTLKLCKNHIASNFLVLYCDLILEDVNLNELWNEHIISNSICTLLLTTYTEPSKIGVTLLEGNKIISFIQKPKDVNIHLGFASVFVASPEVFNFPGSSLEEDLFPELAKEGLLCGHITSKKIINAHSKKDIEKFKNVH